MIYPLIDPVNFVSGMLLASNGNFKVNFNTNKSISIPSILQKMQ